MNPAACPGPPLLLPGVILEQLSIFPIWFSAYPKNLSEYYGFKPPSLQVTNKTRRKPCDSSCPGVFVVNFRIDSNPEKDLPLRFPLPYSFRARLKKSDLYSVIDRANLYQT
jgi:hypothetical protein